MTFLIFGDSTKVKIEFEKIMDRIECYLVVASSTGILLRMMDDLQYKVVGDWIAKDLELLINDVESKNLKGRILKGITYNVNMISI